MPDQVGRIFMEYNRHHLEPNHWVHKDLDFMVLFPYGAKIQIFEKKRENSKSVYILVPILAASLVWFAARPHRADTMTWFRCSAKNRRFGASKEIGTVCWSFHCRVGRNETPRSPRCQSTTKKKVRQSVCSNSG